jgi:hypothetical protein
VPPYFQGSQPIEETKMRDSPLLRGDFVACRRKPVTYFDNLSKIDNLGKISRSLFLFFTAFSWAGRYNLVFFLSLSADGKTASYRRKRLEAPL